MADIEIRRCTVRVVRRQGWHWGNDPRRLLDAAVRALPEIIGAKLGALWPEDGDREIAAPLRIRIPVRSAELMIEQRADGDAAATTVADAPIDHRVDQAIRALIEQACARPVDGEETNDTDVHTDRDKQEPDETSDTLWSGTVLGVLLAWRRQGVLASRLLSFSREALEAWHGSIADAPCVPSGRGDNPADAAVYALADEIVAAAIPVAPGRVKLLCQRLLITIEAIARWGMPPNHPSLLKVLDTVAPLAPTKPFGVADQAAQGSIVDKNALPVSRDLRSEALGPESAPAKRDSAGQRMSLSFAELRVSSALPFLLLGPLARVGYLDAVAATLHAAALVEELPSFATALARKVLDPPERSWYRHPEDIANASAFAGIAEAVPDPRIANFARRVTPYLSPLGALVSGALVDGHREGRPMLVQKSGIGSEQGFLLLDSDGIFPVMWAERIRLLFPSLAKVTGSVVLVPSATAHGEALRELDDAGFSFVTDAPPSRGEHWRRVTNPLGGRWWTNHANSAAAEVSRAAETFEFATAASAALWNALVNDRRAGPIGSGAALEVSLALAASLALGTIAWTLWRDREPVTPLLTLERFNDLDAYVRFDSRSVNVRLPLGRRYRDLYEHGLTADVRNVPWFDGRVLRFSGG